MNDIAQERYGSTAALWDAVAQQLNEQPLGTDVELSWYGPRTRANPPFVRDKLARHGCDRRVEIATYKDADRHVSVVRAV